MSGTRSTNTDAYAWIGANGALWGTAGDWADATTGQTPASSVPGSLTAATIAGLTGSAAEAVAGNGVAASLGVTANVGLLGVIALGGALLVGTETVIPGSTVTQTGSLALSGAAAVTAGTVTVTLGTLSLGAGTSLAASGLISIGTPGGTDSAYGSAYLSANSTNGTISLGLGATLSGGGDLSIASGSLLDAGGRITLAGALGVGTAPTSRTVIPYMTASSGQVVVTAAGTLTIGGGLVDPGGLVFVGGAGSRLVASGTLTGAGSGFYFYGGTALPYSGTLAAGGGGFVQLGGVVLNAPASFSPFTLGISVDAASTIEIGTTGNAASGAITVDAGRQIVVNATANLTGALRNDGIVAVTSGLLTQSGNVTGAGTLQIGQNATLAVNGSVAATETIAFLGSGGALSIGTNGSGPYAVNAVISGFQPGDSIVLGQSVGTAAYTAGLPGTPGTLVLSNAGIVLETLMMAGDFTGETFFVSPSSSNGSSISLTTTTEAQAGTPSDNADAYAWVGPTGSFWSGAGNWGDTTIGASPVGTLPTALTAVTIAVASAELISGDGNAASIDVTGTLTLSGTHAASGALTIGRLAVAASTATLAAGSLALTGTGTISAASIDIVDGSLLLAAGAHVTAAGTIAAGLASGANVPSGGTYLYTDGSAGTINLGAGASLASGAGLSLNAGTLVDAGGQVTVASLTVGTASSSTLSFPYTYPASAQLAVTSAGTIAVGGDVADPGGILFAGGAGSTLLVGGTLTATNSGLYTLTSGGASLTYSGSVVAATGGFVRLGSVVLTTPSVASTTSSRLGLSVDSLSAIEVGSAGNAALGAITIDAGRSIAVGVNASFTGNLVDNGSLGVTGSTLTELGAITGTGVLAINQNATLAVAGPVASGLTIAFQGLGASLSLLTTGTPGTIGAVVTGFQGSDSIVVDQAVTSASFNAASGLLVLSNGATAIETLHLLGDFSGKAFVVTPSSAGAGASIALVGQTPANGGTSPYYLTSSVVGGVAQVQLWVKAGNAVAAANVSVQYSAQQALYSSFVPAAGWTATVATPSASGVGLVLADTSSANPLGGAADAMLGTLSFAPTAGSTDIVVSATVTGGTDGGGVLLGAEQAGAVDVAVQTSVGGTVYDWKSHALLSGVGIVATGAASAADTAATQTDANGSFAVSGLPADIYAMTLARSTADIGHAITAADALAALKIASGINPNPVGLTGEQPAVSAYQFMAADLNGDGRVTAADALAILKLASGLTTGPAAKWEFVAETTDYWNPATNSMASSRLSAPTGLASVAGNGAGVVAVLTGDVNGSWAPLDATGAPLATYPVQPAESFASLSASLGVPVEQWGGASTTVLGAIAGASLGSPAIGVLDTAATVAASIDVLEGLARLGTLAGIWLSDSSVPTLALTGAQVTADADAIAIIHGNYILAPGSTASDNNETIVPVTSSATAVISFAQASATLPALVISGVPVVMDAGHGAHVEGTIGTAGVIDMVRNFSYSASSLGVDLNGLLAADLEASDVTLGGAHAIYLTHGTDMTHGIAILGLSASQTAADLVANHLSFSGRYALIG